MREITYREAIRETLRYNLLNNKDVFLMGEDIGVYGGAFAVTKGLYDEFGPERVRDTPISESAYTGAGVGAAIMGLRPILEIMYIDFTAVAMDQIVNQMAKIQYMSGGQLQVPVVIRTQGGCGRSTAAQHSQSLESWFIHVPGLKIISPSTGYDAKGLLNSAIKDNNPIIFIEHKMLYNSKSNVPPEYYEIPVGKADVKLIGSDVTIITYSRMVHVVLEVATELEKENISIEVIDLRTLLPMDIKTINESVRKTKKVLVVEEDCLTGGVGAEIVARIVENNFDYLDASPVRIAGKDVPIPSSAKLEDLAIPNVKDVITGVRSLLGR